MLKTLTEWRPGARELTAAYGGGLLLLAASAFTVPFAAQPAPVSYAFLAMTMAAMIVETAVIAVLLIVQARALRLLPLLVLGAGFAFGSVAMLAWAISYPGLFLPPGSSASDYAPTAVLWAVWHLAILGAVLLARYLRTRPREDRRLGRRGDLAVSAALLGATVGVALWVFSIRELTVIEDGHWVLGWGILITGIVVIAALAVVITTFGRRRRPTLDLWLAVLALAMALDAHLVLISGEPFRLGWYVARIESLVAVTALLGVLVTQSAKFYDTLLERAETLASEAHTDVLTALPNRRRFDEELVRAFGAAVRLASPLSLLMIDIDHFKRYNDAFGHPAGDVALKRIASVIATSVERSNDFAARFGGEEFVVILSNTPLAGALAVAERIRTEVAGAAIPSADGGPLTVSVGVAERRPGEGRERLVLNADKALYAAKAAGRDRVVAASDALT